MEQTRISADACTVGVATESHERYAPAICALIKAAAQERGTGIAERKAEYIQAKMRERKAVIALYPSAEDMGECLAGFCYIETWSEKRYVANSGLIVASQFRHSGLAKRIKAKAFALSREYYPEARIFSITTSHAVMKLNTELGYKPVPFSELTGDDEFWRGCASCPNYDILQRTGRKMCLCTGMLYQPVIPVLREQNAPATTGEQEVISYA